MSKLVVTGIENGQVSYIMGEEVKVSIEDLKTQISDLDLRLSALPDINVEIAKLKEEAMLKISEAEEEIKDRKATLDKNFEEYKASVEKQLEENKTELLRRDVARADLEREKAKLTAVLSNIEEVEAEAVAKDERCGDNLVFVEEGPNSGFCQASSATKGTGDKGGAEAVAVDGVATTPTDSSKEVKGHEARIVF